ncbi:hypothetical protein OBBRIDRAFT_779112, partial [Obba rivulosa]
MCYHLCTFSEFGCGHTYPLHRQFIDCHRPRCIFSRNHLEEEHDCATGCILEMHHDANIVMPEDLHAQPCNLCLGIPALPGNGAGALHADQNGGNDSD